MPQPRPPAPPSGYELVAELSFREGARVLRVRRDGRDLVCRIDTDRGAAASRAELLVLSAVDHPDLLRLVDHGVTDEGHVFVTREWVEGRDLATWARGRSPEEIGRAVARLCPALAALHARGVTHGDLKPENVLVGEDDRVRLCDFALSHRLGEGARGPAGTLFYVAPEVLSGAAPRPASDLFALGVLLQRLLAPSAVTAKELYARFPGEPYLEATGTAADDLPEWVRDVVAALVERDPARRPASAEAVGRTLAGRLGEAGSRSHVPSIGVREGREAWFERCGAEVGTASEPLWVTVPPGEDPRAVLDALRLDALLAGRTSRELALDVLLGGAGTAADLDAAVERAVAESRAGFLAVAVGALDAWGRRALDCLGRAVRRDADARLVVVASASPLAVGGSAPFEQRSLPALEREHLAAFLSRSLESDSQERLDELAARLADAAGGSAARADALLTRLAHEGVLLGGDERPRLRPGQLPALERLAASVALAADDPRARLCFALALEPAGARVDDLAQLSGLPGEAVATVLRSALDAGLVRVRGAEDGPIARDAGTAAPDLQAATLRELFDRRAARLAARDGEVHEVALFRWLAALEDGPEADGTDLRERALVEALELLRDRGSAELVLDACARAGRFAELLGRRTPAALVAEEALAWTALGQAERAVEAARPLADAGDPAAEALHARVCGAVCGLRHENDRALAHLDRALFLDPRSSGEALVAKVFILHSAGRDGEVCTAVADALAGAQDGSRCLTPRQAVYLRSMRAMSAFRAGRPDAARRELDELLEEARDLGDEGRRAALLIDVGILERRAGSLDRAAELLEESVTLYECVGNVAGLAHARATLGGTLRELGRLGQAEEELGAALGIRERLGDGAGAAAVRGMLGLLASDRGRPRAALSELTRGVAELSAAQRRLFGPLLEAKAEEVTARIGAPSRDEGQRGTAERGTRDPRVLLARARARALRGDFDGALARCEEARSLAKSLERPAAAAEAELFAAALTGLEVSTEGLSPAATDDARVLDLLAAEPERFDAEAAAACARGLEDRGRDDRAARLWTAVAARAHEPELVREARERADLLLRACCVGLSDLEASTFRRHLLGIPDPFPGDLVRAGTTNPADEESEMEVLALLDINHRLVAQEDLSTLLGEIVESALSVTGAERGFLVLEEGGELRFDTALDSCRGDIDAPELEVSRSVVGEALSRGEPVRLSNAQDDPMLGSAPSVVSLDLRSILCVPFRVEDDLRGAIYVDHRVVEDAFNERGSRLLALLADQAALAIRQIRRMGEIRRLNDALRGQVEVKESELRTAQRALEHAGLARPAAGLVGSSAAMRAVHRIVERAAKSDLPALVIGESGTGKELAARGLHELSPWKDGPFVGENCAALPESLIESELFGYKKGAFTGADEDRAGLFERASGGTLFLDEIGEMAVGLQAKLLRVLETSEVRPIGGSETRSVSFRLVAATNRDLEEEVRAGRFRADLFYRLDGLRIEMPALRERAEDVPELVDHFLRLENARTGEARSISRAVVSRLCQRPWPGNVRELANEVSRLCVVSDGDIDDPSLVRDPGAGVGEVAGGPVRTLADLERDAIQRALSETGGDKVEAAKLLGISRSKIYQRLKEWDLWGAGS